ncbi:MAG: YdcF family protein [Oscillatoriales cyanobacterium SM2_2_1]|nr:YdcF family protein [Oscillatoriales cyanobacterium SM2_2_1]
MGFLCRGLPLWHFFGWGEPPREAILVLGGSPGREQFAAEFARRHPDLPVIVSSGSPREYTLSVFARAGVARDRLFLDYRATDTVTNFTTALETLEKFQTTSVYVITDEFHMPRARTIGSIVLGSRGIRMQPLTVTSSIAKEEPIKTLRDGVRSVVWLVTGSAWGR